MRIARKIELLSPAKDLLCGVEAINHGADAVYIGAPQFSARSSAGNSIQDIEELVKYAHRYFARVYVALNTILKEDELAVAETMARQLQGIGVDALIIQDMALTEMNLSIPLHASTQMDNRTPERVRFLENVGFSQVVLARELSLSQIAEISEQTVVPLEVFVHGALCVCYSGQCYLSQAISGRSANRGACAQYCRLPYTLQDATGKTLIANKHLLSLKDMNRSDNVEALLDAGVSSLKIEGRLKDVSYVKNVTAYYRKRLDELFLRRPEYVPAASGHCAYDFVPNLQKSFNRGFTSYFLQGKRSSSDIASFDTPKSIGEHIGTVKDVGRNYLIVAGTTPLNNGDGLCFLDDRGVFQGFRVNRADTNKIYPAEMPRILPRTELYRNYDQAFEKKLSQKTAERKIPVVLELGEVKDGFSLLMRDADGCEATVVINHAKEQARKDQSEQIKTQLSKLGNTVFVAEEVVINFGEAWFLPASFLSDLRQQAVEHLISSRESLRISKQPFRHCDSQKDTLPAVYPQKKLTYLGNVSNSLAKQAYKKYQVEEIDDAYEINPPEQVPLMFTKHCLIYSLGCCKRFHDKSIAYKEPLYLLSAQGRLELEFNCSLCEMLVYKSS